MKTVAIVQARMGSERLPAKIMADLAGKPMLARVVERLSRSASLDDVIVATTVQAADDAVEEFCQEWNFPYFRGSEMDVLDRYYQAAKETRADVVVRCTSDCPLIDPDLVSKVVDRFNSVDVDYLSNTYPERTFPRGLDTEVMHFSVLERVWQEATAPSFREHVTLYILRHRQLFKLDGLLHSKDLSALRWTVDTAEDLALARKFYEHFQGDDFTWLEALEAFEKNVEWKSLNDKIKQKSV